MKRFSFGLDPLLDIRRRNEDEIKRELAEKQRTLFSARDSMAQIHNELKNMQSEEKEFRARAVNVESMRHSVLYRFKLKRELFNKGVEIESLSNQANLVQQKLTRAVQARKAIEMLRERRFAEWKKEVNRKEQIFIDDISNQSYTRKQNSGMR